MAVKRKAPSKKPYKTKTTSTKKKVVSKTPATAAKVKKVKKPAAPYTNQYSSSKAGLIPVTRHIHPYTNQHGSKS